AGVLPAPVQDAVDAVTPFTGDSAPEATPPTTLAPDGDSKAPDAGTGTGTTPGDGPTSGPGTGPTTGTGGGDSQSPAPGTTEPTPTTAPPAIGAPIPGDSPPPPPVTETPVAESMEIHCSLNDSHTAVTCEWTGAPPDTFGKYVLLRTSDDGKSGR